jgi:hypothetical protein
MRYACSGAIAEMAGSRLGLPPEPGGGTDPVKIFVVIDAHHFAATEANQGGDGV